MNARDADTVARPGPPDHVVAGPVAGRQPRPTDPWLRVDGHGASGIPAAGQPGHGRTASLRRQPVRIVEGRMRGGYTDVFGSSAVSAVITPIWTTGRSRPGFS